MIPLQNIGPKSKTAATTTTTAVATVQQHRPHLITSFEKKFPTVNQKKHKFSKNENIFNQNQVLSQFKRLFLKKVLRFNFCFEILTK